MDNLEKTLLTAASGEKRFNPDEMRRYMGTFRERILVTVNKGDGNQPQVKDVFPKVLDDLKQHYDTIKVKSCPNLSQSDQLFYMKIAQEKGISFTSVNENGAHPFDLVIHTDTAVHREETDIFTLYANYFQTEESSSPKKKNGFLHRLLKSGK